MRRSLYYLIFSLFLLSFGFSLVAADFTATPDKSMDERLKGKGFRPVRLNIEGVNSTILWDNRNSQSTSGLIATALAGLPPDSQLINPADDFTVPAGTQWTVDSVYAEGFIYGTTTILPDSIGIIFYDNKAGIPGSIIYSENLIPGGTYPTNLEIVLSTPLELQEGTYWVSIFGVYNGSTSLTFTRWHWYLDDTAVDNIAVLQELTGILGPFSWLPLSSLGVSQPSMYFAIGGQDSVLAGIHDIAVNSVETSLFMIVDETYDILTNIENAGTLDEPNIPISLSEDGVEFFSTSVSLAAGQDSIFTFSYTPSTSGTFELSVVSSFSLDTLNSNDSAFTDVSVLPAGYEEIFFEDFEAGNNTFEIIDLSSDGGVWMVAPTSDYNMGTFSGDSVLTADSDAFGTGMSSAAIIDSLWDFTTDVDEVLFDYDYDFQKYLGGDDTGYVDLSLDGGTTWINLVKYDSDTPFAHETIDVSSYVIGEDSVKFRFRYSTTFLTWWFTIDNVRLLALPTPPLTIAAARADNDNDFVPDLLGQTVTVSGIVATPNFGSGMDYFIHDGTAGINLFSFSNFVSLNIGDEVQVTGEIDQYNGKTEIIPADTANIVVLSTGNPLPSPQVITIADVGEDYEGELIQLDNVWLVDAAQWPSAGSNANVDFTDGSDTLIIRIDRDTDIDEHPAPLGAFTLLGVGGQYDNTTPPDGGYQVQPRFYSDFIIPDSSVLFFDDFESYTAGVQLTVQNSIDWTTWSGIPGYQDPYVSNAYSHSGTNSINIIYLDDVVHQIPNYTTGAYKMSFYLYIPSGTVAYFNTLQQYTPTPLWGMQAFFRVGGAGAINADGDTSATFTYSYDTWLYNEVIVNLEKDTAEFYLDGVRIHGWRWSAGYNGLGYMNKLAGINFFGGAVAGVFNFYVDDYELREISPAVFIDDFDSYTAGTQLVVQNSADWATFSGGSGTGEDPFVSFTYANSSPNSVLIAPDNDIVKTFGSLTSSVYSFSFMTYIPTGNTGYFSILSGFDPNPDEWAMECFLDSSGNGSLEGIPSGAVAFTYLHDTWFPVEVKVDLDQDLAELLVDGVVVSQWQWTQGGSNQLRLDAIEFYGETSTDAMYIDDFTFDTIDPLVNEIDDEDQLIPLTFDLNQNYPNPFNPTTTIKYQLPKKSDVKIVIYNVLGQIVRTLVDEAVDQGYHNKVWDGLNDVGSRVATGIYFYRMKADKFVKTQKMIMMK